MAGDSLSLVGRGFFSFVSVFFSFVLSKREISVISGLSDILTVKTKKQKHLTNQVKYSNDFFLDLRKCYIALKDDHES